MQERLIRAQILDRLASSPAVVLVGPRQSGKTTLARAVGGRYFDLEQEADQLRLDVEWPEVAAGTQPDGPVVLDEAQSWPDLFPATSITSKVRSSFAAFNRSSGI